MTSRALLTLPPSADLAGSHQRLPPLPIDAVGYLRPSLEAWLADAYGAGDGASTTSAGGLQLPELDGVTASAISGIPGTVYRSDTYKTGHSISYPSDPANPIVAGDLIAIWVSTWTDLTTSGPATPGSYTEEFSEKDTGDTYSVRMTLFWKIATGTESGSVALTMPTGAPLAAAMEIYRGVDASNPFDVTESGPVYGATNPNPASITTATDGAVVVAATAARRWSGSRATAPADYEEITNTSLDQRQGIVTAKRTIATGGTAENPGSFGYVNDGSTAMTIALRPGTTAAERTIMVAIYSFDETDSGPAVGSDCQLAGANEVQTLTSTLTSGTFTVTYSGQTTSAIDFDATAGDIETALEALSNIGSGDVRASGGPLDTGPVSVEFIGALAETDVASMTTSTGSVAVGVAVAGTPATDFTVEANINAPNITGDPGGQLWVFSLTPSTYEAGRRVIYEVGDHANIKTWAALITVWSDVDSSDVINWTTSSPSTGSGATVIPPTGDPSVNGSRGIVFVGKALPSGNYSGNNDATGPARTVSAGSSTADSATLDIRVTPPIASGNYEYGPITWPSAEEFAVWSVGLTPAVAPSTGLDIADVVGSSSTDTYAELAAAAGDLYEVIECDASSIPEDGWLTGARARISHEADAFHELTVGLVAISSGGDIVLPSSLTPATPTALGAAVRTETPTVVEFADGTSINDYSRFGVLIRSNITVDGLDTHKLYTAEVDLDYTLGRPTVSSVAGPSSNGGSFTWAYSNRGGNPQSHYQVMAINGAGQDPLTAVEGNPWQGTAGVIIYDSGQVAGPLARSLTLADFPISRSDCTVAVRAWSSVDGTLIPSAWATANYNIAGTPPSAPTGIGPAEFNQDRGVVTIDLTTPADATRAWIHRSTDGGATFQLAPGGPFDIGASTAGTVIDTEPPLYTDTLYRILVDNGDMSESLWVNENPTASTRNWEPEKWFLQSTSDQTLNTAIDVVPRPDITRPRARVTVNEPGGAVSAVSRRMGAVLPLVIRARSRAEREALEALLDLGETLRISDILGRSWRVAIDSDEVQVFQRWQPAPADSGLPIADAHIIELEFIEVRST